MPIGDRIVEEERKNVGSDYVGVNIVSSYYHVIWNQLINLAIDDVDYQGMVYGTSIDTIDDNYTSFWGCPVRYDNSN